MHLYPLALLALLLCCLPLSALAAPVDHGEDCWWCAREDFSLDDDAAVWRYLMADISVLGTDMREKIYLLDAPNGQPLLTGKYEGFFYGASAAVHVLEEQDGWALIEAYDDRNQLLQGYVEAALLRTVSPDPTYGVVVDKQTQRLYVYEAGARISELLVSTGLPEEDKPFNETAAGEFLLASWTGGFWSGNMYCDMGIRFNGGDLLHLVPCLINADETRNHAPFEPLLGTRASHGCVRVQRAKNPDGINMQWLWENLKRNTKLIIWDDTDRPMLYPDDDLPIYYNPNNGKNFHADQYCNHVKDRFLPLTGFRYIELREEPYSLLTPCPYCAPPMMPQAIDAHNEALGFFPEPEPTPFVPFSF
ncbi:MAG: L,D-transpeptidase family protein [Oscillospiraceae bacterium]|nr:L,D-transpeptidase family protein [Oscillospiraceae bacterium]